MGDRLVMLFFLYGIVSAMTLTPRSEALPLHKLYACLSSNSHSDSYETTSQPFKNFDLLELGVEWAVRNSTQLEAKK